MFTLFTFSISVFFFLYHLYVERQREFLLTEIVSLKSQIDTLNLERISIIHDISNTVNSDTKNFLNTTNLFYVFVGFIVVGVSAYFLYNAFNSSASSDVVIDCAGSDADFSLQGSKILAESLKNIDVNVSLLNNVSVKQLAERLLELDLKMNESLYKLDCLVASTTQVAADPRGLSMINAVQENPDAIFCFLQ